MHTTHPAASVACPLSLPFFPMTHPWHKANEDDPSFADHRPRGQFPQSSTTLAPNVVTYRPAGQAVQSGFLPYLCGGGGGWRGYCSIFGSNGTRVPVNPNVNQCIIVFQFVNLPRTFPYRTARCRCKHRQCSSASNLQCNLYTCSVQPH